MVGERIRPTLGMIVEQVAFAESYLTVWRLEERGIRCDFPQSSRCSDIAVRKSTSVLLIWESGCIFAFSCTKLDLDHGGCSFNRIRFKLHCVLTYIDAFSGGEGSSRSIALLEHTVHTFLSL